MESHEEKVRVFSCEPCQFTCDKLSKWNRHTTTSKHLGERKRHEKGPMKLEVFTCNSCNLLCGPLSKWNRHILTRKHLAIEKGTKKVQTDFACKKCKKLYISDSDLMQHERQCETGIIDRLLNDNIELRNFIIEQTKYNSKTIETIMTNNNETINKTIESMMVQNNENMNKTTETIIELCKPINNNTTIHQTNNQKFNIQIFLNEQCKDAINFSDFINNIQISYEDLENNAQLGFVGGISKIFLDKLKQLDVTERPIHCTDVKRETIYIKDENTWTKQPDDKKLQKAIQTVSYRSMGKLAEWKQENPDYKDCNSKFSQKCLDIHRHTLAGSEREVYYPKVIHVLARETANGLSNTLIQIK